MCIYGVYVCGMCVECGRVCRMCVIPHQILKINFATFGAKDWISLSEADSYVQGSIDPYYHVPNPGLNHVNINKI